MLGGDPDKFSEWVEAGDTNTSDARVKALGDYFESVIENPNKVPRQVHPALYHDFLILFEICISFEDSTS